MKKSLNLVSEHVCPHFVCVLAVWGELYTRIFLETALPAQLASDNLPALEKAVYQIYTTREDAEAMRQHPSFLYLQQIMPVEFHYILEEIDNRYLMMSDCHKRAINYANNLGSALIFLTPDCVISNGSLKEVKRLVNSGVRLISTVGLRLKSESVRILLKTHQGDNISLNIGSQELMKIALDYLHPITLKHIWGGDEEMIPNNLFWLIPKEGLLGRCFHLHPLMVYPRICNSNFVSTIDYDYPLSACPDPSDHYVVTDSDAICICELTTETRQMKGVKNGSMRDLLYFTESYVNSNHKNNALTPIRMHTRKMTETDWQVAIQESDQILNEIFLATKTHSLILAFTKPGLLLRRLMSRGQEAAISSNLIFINKYAVILMGKMSKLILMGYGAYLWRAKLLVRIVKNPNITLERIKWD